MGFLDQLLGSLAQSKDDDDSDTSRRFFCETCGSEVDDEDDLEDGECDECAAEEYTGPKYCCGIMYDQGEDTCMSCGDPL